MKPIESKFIIRNQNALRSTRATYHLLVHAGNDGFVANSQMTSIDVEGGHVWVNGIPINAPKFTPDHISWRQHTANGYSAGCVYLYDGGLSVHGAISHGPDARTASHFDVAGTAIKPIAYRTRISKSPQPIKTDPSKIPDSDFEDGLALEIGYETRIGDSGPRPTVSLGGQDITDQTSWRIDLKGRTVLQINLDAMSCKLAPTLYRTAEIGFNPYDFTVQGTGIVQATCQSASPTNTALLWTAKPQPQTARFVVAKRAAAAAQLVAADNTLQVRELITLLPDDQVNQDANSMLIRNMKWAMGQDGTERQWLADFFGQTPPAGIPDNQTALITKSLDWYQHKFAMGYMTQAFNTYKGPNEPSTRLDTDQGARLDNFLRNGLAKSPEFNVQHQGIYVDAYIGARPRVADYLADAKKNGTDWAKRVFDELTGGPQFILIVNRVAGAAGDSQKMGPVNNFACLLTVLDPSGKTANAYIQSVLSGVIAKLIPETSQDKETTMQWLPTTMQEFLRKLANGEIPGQTDISQTEAKEMYQFYLQHTQEITSNIADLLQSISAMGLVDRTQKLEEGFESIGERFPKIAKAARFLFVIGWIGGVSSIIVALVKGNWDKMTDVEKAQFVTTCAQSVIQGFQAVPEIFNGIKSLNITIWKKVSVTVQAPENQVATKELGQQLAETKEDVPYVAVEELSGAVTEVGQVGRATVYTRLFGESIAGGVVKILGAVAAVAMAAYSLWQLINDVKTQGSVSTIVFDSIVFATTFLSAVCLVADLFVATTFLPIVGAVLAIVGIIASFIAQFVDKPKNPVEEWMKANGVSFARDLPAPEPAFA